MIQNKSTLYKEFGGVKIEIKAETMLHLCDIIC